MRYYASATGIILYPAYIILEKIFDFISRVNLIKKRGKKNGGLLLHLLAFFNELEQRARLFQCQACGFIYPRPDDRKKHRFKNMALDGGEVRIR